MSKIMLLLALLITIPAWANDQNWFKSQKPVTCGPFREIVENLMRPQVGEAPLWIGKSNVDETGFVLFYNAKNRTWTLIQYGTEIGCVLGTGDTSDIVDLTVLPRS